MWLHHKRRNDLSFNQLGKRAVNLVRNAPIIVSLQRKNLMGFDCKIISLELQPREIGFGTASVLWQGAGGVLSVHLRNNSPTGSANWDSATYKITSDLAV